VLDQMRTEDAVETLPTIPARRQVLNRVRLRHSLVAVTAALLNRLRVAIDALRIDSCLAQQPQEEAWATSHIEHGSSSDLAKEMDVASLDPGLPVCISELIQDLPQNAIVGIERSVPWIAHLKSLVGQRLTSPGSEAVAIGRQAWSDRTLSWRPAHQRQPCISSTALRSWSLVVPAFSAPTSSTN
jgi:hypothetical protein